MKTYISEAVYDVKEPISFNDRIGIGLPLPVA